MRKLFDMLWVNREGNKSLFIENTIDEATGAKYLKVQSFNELELRIKIKIVYHLCEYRLYSDDASDLIANHHNLTEDDFRMPEPLALDSKGYKFWYFGFGTRLYQENSDVLQKIEDKLLALEKLKDKEFNDRFKLIEADLKKKRQLEEEEIKKKTQETSADVSKSSETSSSPEPPKKRSRGLREPIPGERCSTRGKKPVERLTINGFSSSTPKSSSSSESSIENRNDINHTRNGRITKAKASQVKENNSRKADPEIIRDVNTSCGIPLEELSEGWKVACDTLESWNEMISSRSKSKHPNDMILYERLTEILPKISEIYEKIEKNRMKESKAKALELVPRRISSRIEVKKIQKEEEDKKRSEQMEILRRQKLDADERRKREAERLRLEEMKKQREERNRTRLAVMEDRAARAALRQRESELRLKRQMKREMRHQIKASLMMNGHSSQTNATSATSGSSLNGFDDDEDNSDSESEYDSDDNIYTSDGQISPYIEMTVSDGWPLSESVLS